MDPVLRYKPSTLRDMPAHRTERRALAETDSEGEGRVRSAERGGESARALEIS